MVALTIIQAIEGQSLLKIGIGKDIETEDLAILQALVVDDLATFCGGRFTGDALTRIEGLFVLDAWINRHGKGVIRQESVTDNSYTADIVSSSGFMDIAIRIRDKFDLRYDTATSDYTSAGGVLRDDSYPSSITDGYVFPYHYG